MILDRRLMAIAQCLCRSLSLAGLLYGASASAGTPDEIRVPGEIPGTALHAEGAQIYECQPDAAKQLAWQPREPAATLMDGGNSVGAHIAGVLPMRAVGGRSAGAPGLNAADMVAARLKAYLVLGGIEPQHDIAASTALDAFKAAEFVVALSPYSTAKEYADVILPIGTYAETSGTYVNLEGRWQSVPGAAKPVGDSRPGWKVLRVLGNLLNLSGFDYVSSDQVMDEVRMQFDEAGASVPAPTNRRLQAKLALSAPASNNEVPLYQVDALVRRAASLQQTQEAHRSQGEA